MTESITYTPEEVAGILKISKYTVYELIKRGELGAYRIGRKVRVEASDIERYKQRSKNLGIPSDIPAVYPDLHTEPLPPKVSDEFSSAFISLMNNGLVICGQDIILDILTRYLAKQFPNIRFLRNHIGSMNGITALYRGEANVITIHLWDGDTNDYNLPYVRHLMPGHEAVIINLVHRMEGFYVAAGNPKKIKSWQDLSRPDVRFVNREHGSGARVLLDEKLRIEKISRHLIKGYDDEEMSHTSVASKVARGEADIGLGIEKAAMQVTGIQFIPLQKERYDLVIRREDQAKPHFQALLEIVRSSAYRKEVEGLGGYDVSQMGEIMNS